MAAPLEEPLAEDPVPEVLSPAGGMEEQLVRSGDDHGLQLAGAVRASVKRGMHDGVRLGGWAQAVAAAGG